MSIRARWRWRADASVASGNATRFLIIIMTGGAAVLLPRRELGELRVAARRVQVVPADALGISSTANAYSVYPASKSL